MRIGAGFPSLDLPPDAATLRAWVSGVERLGFHHMVVYEHVLGFAGAKHDSTFGPLTNASRFREPLTLLSFLAGVTERVELATSVLVLPQRQTALVAKQAAEVDALSGGRLRLGVGVGWAPEEFAALGVNFDDRGPRCDEQIAVLRALWTESEVTFHGRWHTIDRAGISPPPAQRPIPLWVGGHSERALRRVGRLADGWMPVGIPAEGGEMFRAMLATIRRHAAAAGRDPDALGMDAQIIYGWVAGDDGRACAHGWRDLGATHLTVTTMGLGTSDIAAHLDTLARVIGAVGAEGLVDPIA